MKPALCMCVEAVRNRVSDMPEPATIMSSDGDPVCRFCWHVISEREDAS